MFDNQMVFLNFFLLGKYCMLFLSVLDTGTGKSMHVRKVKFIGYETNVGI